MSKVIATCRCRWTASLPGLTRAPTTRLAWGAIGCTIWMFGERTDRDAEFLDDFHAATTLTACETQGSPATTAHH